MDNQTYINQNRSNLLKVMKMAGDREGALVSARNYQIAEANITKDNDLRQADLSSEFEKLWQTLSSQGGTNG